MPDFPPPPPSEGDFPPLPPDHERVTPPAELPPIPGATHPRAQKNTFNFPVTWIIAVLLLVAGIAVCIVLLCHTSSTAPGGGLGSTLKDLSRELSSTQLPAKQQVQEAVAVVLPPYLSLDSIELDPVSTGPESAKVNFKVVVVPKEDLCRVDREVEGTPRVTLIKVSRSAGSKLSLYGFVEAKRIKDQWMLAGPQFQVGLDQFGTPRRAFGERSYVTDSSEAIAALNEQAANEAMREREKRAAIEQDERDRTNRMEQARLAAEAKAKAEAEVRRRLLLATVPGANYLGTISERDQRQNLRLVFTEQKDLLINAEASNPDRSDEKQTFTGEIVLNPEPERGAGYNIVMRPVAAQGDQRGRWAFYQNTGLLKLCLTKEGLEGHADIVGYNYTIILPRDETPAATVPIPLAENRVLRTWTFKSGVTLKASLIEESKGMVILKTEDGAKVVYSESVLNYGDQHYLQDIKKELFNKSNAGEGDAKGHYNNAPDPVAVPGSRTTIDLLSLIDLDKDVIRGTWTKHGNSVELDPEVNHGSMINGVLEIPYIPAAEYDLLFEFEPFEGRNRLVLWVSSGEKSRMMILAGGESSWDVNKGVNLDIRTGKKYNLILKVRKEGIDVLLDGKTVGHSSFEKMEDKGYWRLRHDGWLAVGSHETGVSFNKIQIVEISGKGRAASSQTP